MLGRILGGLRMLTLKEMVTKYLEDALYAHRGPAATQASLLHAHTPTRKMEEEDADVDHAKRLPLSEQSGFQRYICSATTGLSPILSAPLAPFVLLLSPLPRHAATLRATRLTVMPHLCAHVQRPVSCAGM